MTVEELFRKLSHGDLSNLSSAVDASGTIKKERQNQVVHFANEGLKALHSRFQLLLQDEVVTLTGAEMTHPLPANAIQLVSILLASGQPVVFGSQPIPGTFYVYQRSLYIPKSYAAGTELQLTYQCKHPTLTDITAPADLAQVIDLVIELEGALTANIAAQAYGNILTPEGQRAAEKYQLRYEQLCQTAVHQGLVPGELMDQSKFDQRGWV